MKCPYCGDIDNKVIDSRLSKDASVIRRRRECIGCSRRFTTYEHIEEIPIMIIKKDGRREVFSREKIRSGIKRACEKRDISMNVIEEFIDELERDLREIQEAAVRWGFSADDIGLVTGNRRVNPDAPILVVVAEILFNRLLHRDSFDFDGVAAVARIIHEALSRSGGFRQFTFAFAVGGLHLRGQSTSGRTRLYDSVPAAWRTAR